MMSAEVRFEQQKHLGVITLSRPQALNALTLAMIKLIYTQLIQWQTEPSIHAIVIRGEGEKAFCAGGDVRWLYDQGRDQHAELMNFFANEYRLNRLIHEYPKPFIALLNGITMGGGVGVGLHGSHPIASDTFKFAMPETTIGFFPDVGASYLLARCPGALGIYLGLTGHRLGAHDALYVRLVKSIVPSDRFDDLFIALLNADLSEHASQRVDQSVAEYALSSEQTPQIALVQDLINQCFSCNTIEAILERLAMLQTEWANSLHADLLMKSPLSLKVTLEQLRRTNSLSMAECIKMDYDLAGHFMAGHDFFEGVRALLVDKDKSPHWQPSTLAAVTHEIVAAYFETIK